MSRVKRIVILSIVAIGVIAASIVTWRIVRHNNDNKRLYLYGNVDVRQVDMGFRVPGKVETLYFEEGDLVKEGDLLARLDKLPYDSEVRRAEGLVEATVVKLENANILLRRREALIEVGGVSQEDLDNALTNRNQLVADLIQAKAQLQVAKDNYTFTDVFAPTDAVVLTRIREPGSVVQPSEPVYTLSVVSPVWIRAYIAEPHLGDIAYGMTAKVYTDTPNEKVYTAKIGFISPVAEFTPKTVETTELRTDLVYRLRLYVDNPDWALKQGMPVTVKIPLKKRER